MFPSLIIACPFYIKVQAIDNCSKHIEWVKNWDTLSNSPLVVIFETTSFIQTWKNVGKKNHQNHLMSACVMSFFEYKKNNYCYFPVDFYLKLSLGDHKSLYVYQNVEFLGGLLIDYISGLAFVHQLSLLNGAYLFNHTHVLIKDKDSIAKPLAYLCSSSHIVKPY